MIVAGYRLFPLVFINFKVSYSLEHVWFYNIPRCIAFKYNKLSYNNATN